MKVQKDTPGVGKYLKKIEPEKPPLTEEDHSGLRCHDCRFCPCTKDGIIPDETGYEKQKNNKICGEFKWW